MNLINPHYLWLLVLILPLIWLLIRRQKRELRRFSAFAESMFHSHYLGGNSAFYTNLKAALFLLALGFMIFALVRPQWDYETRDYDVAGFDIVFCIDVSKSMDASDLPPSRLIRAKIQIESFIKRLKGDRIAIVAFAGNASLMIPLTDDYESVGLILNSLNTDTIGEYGTNIGLALEIVADALATGSDNRLAVLISDGEDHSGRVTLAAQELKRQDIPVYSMGVGSPEGGMISHPVYGGVQVTAFDVETLKEIAAQTGGEFFAVTPGQAEIDLLLQKIYATERQQSTIKGVSSYKEQYHFFGIAALLFVLLESFLPPWLKRKTMV
ncbi:MAG: VWA domain-containing protein [Candidatus Cloacimonetes bacterium]|nr:VWA domain-containing protein [Candidatus Cloacimonadota bacterium]